MKKHRIAPLAAAVMIAALAAAATAQVGKSVDEEKPIVNPNRASVEDMVKLPGMTAALADAIVAARPHLDMVKLNKIVATVVKDEAARKELYAKFFLPINLNKTTRAEILLVPGVGDKMAGEFEEYRPYAALAVFKREMGKYVDDEEVARLSQYVFVPINLNDATDEAILSIPGMGRRMLREFKEYRPYVAIEQFRREMGKYVDEKEVARLERYVVIEK